MAERRRSGQQAIVRLLLRPGAWLALGLALVACVGGAKEDREQALKRVQQYVLGKAPKKLQNKLEHSFAGKVSLVGYDISPASGARPGSKVTLTMYWKLEQKLEPGWGLFTHVLDGSGERLLNIDTVGPLREWTDSKQLLGPSDWEVGKYYVDQQVFVVPDRVKTKQIKIVTGLWKGEQRLEVVKGPHDSENRALVALVNVGVESKKKAKKKRSKANTKLPRLRVRKLDPDQKITIDGKLDEKAWRRASSTPRFVDVATGGKNKKFPVNGRVKVLYDDKAMYLGFDIQDEDVTGGFEKTTKDPHLWTRDAVEIMIDPDGNGDNKDYYEIQINPQNLVFDSRFDDYNEPKGGDDGPFGHQEWSAKLQSAVAVQGTIDKPNDKDEGYVVEVRIEWASFDKAKEVPPPPGATWRMNFYAMQNNSGVAWSPILGKGNFHRASRFGTVIWGQKTGGNLKVDRNTPFGLSRERMSRLKGKLTPKLEPGVVERPASEER